MWAIVLPKPKSPWKKEPTLVSKTSKTSAEAQFKKTQRAEEGAKAMAEYEAEAHATRLKTARLKELRLAKEAADSKAAEGKVGVKASGSKTSKASGAKASSTKAAGTKTPAKKAAKSKEKTVPLSDWLTKESGSGRRG